MRVGGSLVSFSILVWFGVVWICLGIVDINDGIMANNSMNKSETIHVKSRRCLVAYLRVPRHSPESGHCNGTIHLALSDSLE